MRASPPTLTLPLKGGGDWYFFSLPLDGGMVGRG
jgi:hypothetical protein